MTEVIRTDTLTKKYRSVAALDHVNLEVQEGAVYALVGQNGAGKTTAIKILMNLIPASQGTAQVLGTDSRKIRGQAYTQIGYVSENQEIPEWMKVGALLDYLRDFYPTWDLDLEQSLVKQLNLSATLILSFAINSPKAFSSAPPNLLSSSPPTTSPK
jgi:ABC-2 type transport system ATP-binding protein